MADRGISAQLTNPGQNFQITNFELNVQFMAHFFVSVSDFETFAYRLSDLLLLKAFNGSGDTSVLFDALRQIADETVKIHPSWKEAVNSFMEQFIRDKQQQQQQNQLQQ